MSKEEYESYLFALKLQEEENKNAELSRRAKPLISNHTPDQARGIYRRFNTQSAYSDSMTYEVKTLLPTSFVVINN